MEKWKKEAKAKKAKFEMVQEAADHCVLEVMDSYDEFPDFNSYHEGYAVIKEEVDELWDEIKTYKKDKQAIEEEAIQVAAMAIKLLVFMKKEAISNPKELS